MHRRYFSIELIKLILLPCLPLFISACVSVSKVPPLGDAQPLWVARSEYLYSQNNWRAQMSLLGMDGEQKFKTRADWTQKNDSYQIKLRDFIGRTIAIVDGQPLAVEVKTSKGQHYQGDNAEALINELFAINIPVSGMRYWLQGVPVPEQPVDRVILNAEGLAESISQQGWEITYPHYQFNEPYKMPGHVQLEFENIKLSVKITEWVLTL